MNSNHFCRDCHILLNTEIENEELVKSCCKCKNVYEALPDDTLCYEYSTAGNISIYEIILKKAGRDPVNLKAAIKCGKCSNGLVRQVRVGEDMKLFNICTECSHHWLYE